ncbi:MAG: GNAT family N-acetyltransferase [Balneolales bacterium]
MTKNKDLVSISVVESRADFYDFLRFPYTHYKNDENWIAPLHIQQKHLVDRKKNPFYLNADAEFYLAKQGGEIIGRIAAIDNKAYNSYNSSNVGFFGFFECVNNQFAADLLFKIARDWLNERGLTSMRGPTNPGMLDEIGILVEGFDTKPAIMMPYSKPWYDDLLKGAGFEKAMDLFAYGIDKKSVKLDRLDRAQDIVMKRIPGLKIRPVNTRQFNSEVKIIHEIFNKAWANNWGFYETSVEEFAALGKEIKMILDVDLAHVAEVDGKPVGFSVALPDINQALQHLDGSLFPTGILKLLFYKRKINAIRTALMGVIPEYQGRGIDALLHRQAIENGLKKGYVSSELSWLLETNTHIIRVAERLGGKRLKTYRIYQQ